MERLAVGRRRLRVWPLLLSAVLVVGGCSSATSSHPANRLGGLAGRAGYLGYWDHNEEVDFLSQPTRHLGQLFPPWDLNGQMCVLPDGSGRFVGGLDPTVPSQHNPGGLRPYKQPAIGEELNNRDGSYSGRVLYVPGPYKLPGQSIGDDTPPD